MNTATSSPPLRWFDREAVAALGVILLLSLMSFAYVYSLQATDLDGDGWAHVKRARHLTDAINPGYWQIGTVWLPLFHLLAAPLARNDFLWRTGWAGSFISMASFVVGGIALLLMMRQMFEPPGIRWLGLAVYLLNPSWLYYQTTPMQEPLALALLSVNVLLLMEWQRRGKRTYLFGAAMVNVLASLNRYEGWFFTLFATFWVLAARLEGMENRSWRLRIKEAFVYGFLAALAPIYWLAHNWLLFGDALEFIRGPYSAQALYLRQIATSHFRYPTEGHWGLSWLYYSKSVRYGAGETAFWMAVAGLLIALFQLLSKKNENERAVALKLFSWRTTHFLFLVPFFFYVLSLAHGRAPTYVADYFPYTNFGVRYGHTPIPAGVTLCATFFAAVSIAVKTTWLRRLLVLSLLGMLLFPVGLALRTRLHSLPAHEEPYVNNADDRRILSEVAAFLRTRWHGEMILMNSGYLGRVAQLDEIPFRKIIFEDNRNVWEMARRYPFPEVGWVIAEEGDAVWEMVRSVPAYREYYREEKVIRGIKAHVIHIYRHHVPMD